jgi:hypothetical protein
MFTVRRAFSKQNDGGKDEVQPDMDDNGDPDQDAEALGEVEHEDVCTDTELDQRHAIQV